MSSEHSPSGKSAQDAAAQAANRLVGRATITFGVCMVAVLICSRLPLPWALAGIGFAFATFVAGAKALKAIKAAPPMASSMQFLILLGLALTVFSSLPLLLQAALYPDFYRYQTCQQQALTETAKSACTKDFTDSVTNLFPGLQTLVGTG